MTTDELAALLGGTTVEVEGLPLPTVVEEPSTDTVLVPVIGPVGPKGEDGYVGADGKPGPPGPQGPAGPAFEGTAWFDGEGEPDLIIGAKAGDKYIDRLTGTVYTLI